MPSPIEVLPTELFLHVLTHLRTADLAALQLVSKRYKELIGPIVWSKIELHRPCFHEDYTFIQLVHLEEAIQRPYQECDPDYDPRWTYKGRDSLMNEYDMDRGFDVKSRLFLRNFEPRRIGEDARRKMRVEELAALVKWLCLPVNGMHSLDAESDDGHEERSKNVDPWNALARLTNLEYLEVSAHWKGPDVVVVPFDKNAAPKMDKLKVVKLRGYVPKAFVRHLLRNGAAITELQLGVLDKPIGLYQNPATVSEDEEEDQAEVDDEDDEEVLEGDGIAPRALACLTPGIISSLTSLTHLYLVRPAQASDDDDFDEFTTSVAADRRILREWAALLRATRGTLQHIILDQRPVGGENEPDGTDNVEFMHYYSHGPGYIRFVKIVLPALLEDGWSNLQSIKLFGFEFDSRDMGAYYNSGRSLPHYAGVDLPRQLRARFPEVEVESALGRRMLFESHGGTVEVGGDVLDCLNSFTEEEDELRRKRRRGPSDQEIVD